MTITFTDNFKVILDKVEKILEDEFKGLKVVVSESFERRGNEFVWMRPLASAFENYATSSQDRLYAVEINYYMYMKVSPQRMDRMLNRLARIDRLIVNNRCEDEWITANLENINLAPERDDDEPTLDEVGKFTADFTCSRTEAF